VPLYPEMVTAPGERRKLYMDVMPLTQGFDNNLSVLGGDIWSIVLERLKRSLLSGPGGYILNLHGRQFFQLHNLFRGLGKRVGLMVPTGMGIDLAQFDESIYETYVAEKATDLVKQGRRTQVRLIFTMLPSLIRAMLKRQRHTSCFYVMLIQQPTSENPAGVSQCQNTAKSPPSTPTRSRAAVAHRSSRRRSRQPASRATAS
jgi:hypothetical protein